MNENEWEKICRRCGECCFEKWIGDDEQIRYTRIPCRHLDVVSRQCRVYHKRFDVGEGCIKLTPEVVRNAAWLPQSCSYRRTLSAGAQTQAPAVAPSSSSSRRLVSDPSPAE